MLPLLLSFLLATAAFAVEPSEMLKDPALEARARSISRELRCLVCQNQSIDESNADLAHDLRVIVRERLTAGDSDDQVRAYLVARYGDFVLLDPPFKAKTLLLWCGPAVLLLLGAGGIYALLRRRQDGTPALPLNEAERSRLAELMAENAETPLGGREPGQG
ncbi:MAG TPA: cytochrome c-type biogenesis protein [Dongiaceae bacterium]